MNRAIPDEDGEREREGVRGGGEGEEGERERERREGGWVGGKVGGREREGGGGGEGESSPLSIDSPFIPRIDLSLSLPVSIYSFSTVHLEWN